jgi:hypothetical protein
MWGHSRACMAPNTDSMPRQLTSLLSLRWRPSLLAESNQARCEAHPVARRVGVPPGPLPTNQNPLGGDLSLLESRAVPAKKKRGFTQLIRRPFRGSYPPRSPRPVRGAKFRVSVLAGCDRVFLRAVTRRSPPTSLPPNGGRGRGSKESTRLNFFLRSGTPKPHAGKSSLFLRPFRARWWAQFGVQIGDKLGDN